MPGTHGGVRERHSWALPWLRAAAASLRDRLSGARQSSPSEESVPRLKRMCLPGPCPHQAYDQHLNMILGEVEETLTTVEIDDETYEEIIKARGCMHESVHDNACALSAPGPGCVPACMHPSIHASRDGAAQ